MSQQVSVRKSGNVTILDLRGRITFGTASDLFRAELRKLVETAPCDVLVNLSEVTQIDSAGIGALVQSYVTLTRRGGSLGILKPSDRVREVLEVTHVIDSITIYMDEAEALAKTHSRHS